MELILNLDTVTVISQFILANISGCARMILLFFLIWIAKNIHLLCYIANCRRECRNVLISAIIGNRIPKILFQIQIELFA